jgi:hypothetical protein
MQSATQEAELLDLVIRSFPGQISIQDRNGSIIASKTDAVERSKGIWREWVQPSVDGITVTYSIREF